MLFKLTKNADPDKYSYSEYSIGYDTRGTFFCSNTGFGKNVIIFGVANSSFVHADIKKKNKS